MDWRLKRAMGKKAARRVNVKGKDLTPENLTPEKDLTPEMTPENGGPAGVGATLTVPKTGGFADALLSPGQFVDVPFVICLKTRTAFSFFVDVMGVTK